MNRARLPRRGEVEYVSTTAQTTSSGFQALRTLILIIAMSLLWGASAIGLLQIRVMTAAIWSLPVLFVLHGILCPDDVVPTTCPRFLAETFIWCLGSRVIPYLAPIHVCIVSGLVFAWVGCPTGLRLLQFAFIAFGLMYNPPESPTDLATSSAMSLIVGMGTAALLREADMFTSQRRFLTTVLLRSLDSVVRRFTHPELLHARLKVAGRIVSLWAGFLFLEYVLNVSAGGTLVFVSLLLGLRALTRPHPSRTPLEGQQSVFLSCVIVADVVALFAIPRWLLPLLGNAVMNAYLLSHLFPMGQVAKPLTPEKAKAPRTVTPLPVPEHLRAKLGKRNKEVVVSHTRPISHPAQPLETPPTSSSASSSHHMNSMPSDGTHMSMARVAFLIFLTATDWYVRTSKTWAPRATAINNVLSANTLGYSAIILLSTYLQNRRTKSPPPPAPKAAAPIPLLNKDHASIHNVSGPNTPVTVASQPEELVHEEERAGTPEIELTPPQSPDHQGPSSVNVSITPRTSPEEVGLEDAGNISTPPPMKTELDRRKWQETQLRDLVMEEEHRKASETLLRQRKEAARSRRQAQREGKLLEAKLKEQKLREEAAEKQRIKREAQKLDRERRREAGKTTAATVMVAHHPPSTDTAVRDEDVQPISQFSTFHVQEELPPTTTSTQQSLFSAGAFGVFRKVAAFSAVEKEYSPFGGLGDWPTSPNMHTRAV